MVVLYGWRREKVEARRSGNREATSSGPVHHGREPDDLGPHDDKVVAREGGGRQ